MADEPKAKPVKYTYTEHKLIGKDFTVPDIHAKVTGRAKYVEDFRMDNMVFCKTLTSPIPHAKINKIDTTEALKMPGVLGILTADDVPQFPPPAQGIFAKDETFFVGEPILAVAADTEENAVAAIEAIKIDFQELPHVTDPLESLFPGGPNARTGGNVAGGGGIKLQTMKWEGTDFATAGDSKLPLGRPAEEWHYGDVDAGFKKAKVIVEENFVSGTFSHNCMEPRSAFAYWQGGKCFLYGSNQSHTAAIANVSRYIGIKPDQLVFIAEYCGGGFGSKIPGYPNMAIAALMSKKINRPVMHRISRYEEYGIGSARPGFQGYVKMGFAPNGKMVAADLYIIQESGPMATAGDFRAAGNAMSLVYQPESMRFRTVPVLTNTVPVGAQRGPGENQLTTMIEPMIDKAARQLNIDRFDIRIMNAPDSNSKFGSEQGPVTSAYLKDALAKLRTFVKWEDLKKKSGQKNGTKVTGIGIGQGYHSAGSNGFDGLLRITPDGKLHVHTGVGNLGTHSWASTARVAPDLLNVSWDNTIIERGDTRRGLPANSPQAGSLTASTESRTMYAAAMDMKDKLTDIAAQILGGKPEDYVLGDEKVVAKSGGKSITYQQAAQKAVALGGKYSGKEVPDELNPITKSAVAMIAGSGLVAAAKDKAPRVGTTPGLTCNVAEVEIDTETGVMEVKQCYSVVDVGTVLFPLGLGHQIASGQILGTGMAHLERHLYDPKLGIPAAVGFHQGKVPTYLDIAPNMLWQAVEKPDTQHPLGIKGVGEPSLGSGASCITSAIADAMGGYLFNRTPVTADMILNHLSGRQPAHKPLQVNTA